DFARCAFMDLTDLPIGRKAAFDESRAKHLDWIRPLDYSGAIRIGDHVAGPVPAATVSNCIDERGPISPSGTLDRFAAARPHRSAALPAPGSSRNPIPCGSRRDRRWQIAVRALRNRPAVVLTDVDDRQTPDGGQIDVLVEIAAIGGAVAEAAHADAIG